MKILCSLYWKTINKLSAKTIRHDLQVHSPVTGVQKYGRHPQVATSIHNKINLCLLLATMVLATGIASRKCIVPLVNPPRCSPSRGDVTRELVQARGECREDTSQSPSSDIYRWKASCFIGVGVKASVLVPVCICGRG